LVDQKFSRAYPKKKKGGSDVKDLEASSSAAENEFFDEFERVNFFEEKEPYTKKSKQLMDGKLRQITKDDLQRPQPPSIEKPNVEVAIQGGLGALSFSFLENQILHAAQTLFSKANYPDEIKLSRWQLYEAMGLKSYMKDGKKIYLEGPKGKQRKRIHETFLEMARKTYLFMFSQEYKNKKNEIRYRLGLTYEPIMKVSAIYEDIKQLEFEGITRDPEQKKEPPKKRFSHYKMKLNPHAIGEVDKYFRYIPSGLSREILEYRKQKGGKASGYEFDFIEYLYTESRERVEINYLKLAEKLRIKHLKYKKETRRILARCYETARDLNFLIKVEIDQPGLRARKDVFYLNQRRFYKLKKEVKKDRSPRNLSPPLIPGVK